MSRPGSRSLAFVMAATIIVSSCSASRSSSSTQPAEVSTPPSGQEASAPTSPPTPDPTAPVDSAPFVSTPAPPAELLTPLTSAGISVTSIDDPVPGPGITFTDWQAANLIRQAEAHNGVTGLRLRTMLPFAEDIVPIDAIVGAWLITSTSAASDSARTMLPAEQIVDTATVVFPWAVLALFIQDLAFGGDATAGGPSRVTHSAPMDQPKFDLCGSLLNLYTSTLNAIYDALGGRDSVWGKLAQYAIGALPIPKPVFHVPEKGGISVFAALGLLISVAGAINPWTLSVEAIPKTVAYGVEPAPGNDGILRGVIDPNGATEWPESLKSCAALLGVDLPDIDPVASFIKWDLQFADHAHPRSEPTAVVENIDGVFRADVPYLTSVESAEQATGTPTEVLIGGIATVQRPGGQTLQAVLKKIVDAALDSSGTVGALVITFLADSLSELQELIDPIPDATFVTVTLHIPPPPPATDPPPETAAPPDPTQGPCIGRDLFSTGAPGLPSGILLRLGADHSVLFDFNSSSALRDSSSGIQVSIQVAGTIKGTWEGTVEEIVSNHTDINIGATTSIGGSISQLPPEYFDSFGTTSETMTCTPDGSIVIQRTGQVYS